MITEPKKRDVALVVDDSPETLRLLTGPKAVIHTLSHKNVDKLSLFCPTLKQCMDPDVL